MKDLEDLKGGGNERARKRVMKGAVRWSFSQNTYQVVKFSTCYQSHRSAVLSLSPTSTSSQQAFSLSFLQPAGLFFVISLFHILLDFTSRQAFSLSLAFLTFFQISLSRKFFHSYILFRFLPPFNYIYILKNKIFNNLVQAPMGLCFSPLVFMSKSCIMVTTKITVFIPSLTLIYMSL